MNPAAEAAVRYTALGYRVYPVNVSYVDGKKRPSFKGGAWDPAKGAEYPTEPDEIRAHWEGFSGVAINTGLSGVVGIDIDQGNGKSGMDNLRAAGVQLDPTPMVAMTPSGGRHLLYRAHPDHPAPTKKDIPVPQVDVRGVGGILFAYPTAVGDNAYNFIGDEWVGPADLPVISDQWLKFFREREQTHGNRRSLPSDPGELLQRVRDLPPGGSWDELGPLSMRYAAVCLGRGQEPDDIAEAFVEAFRDRGTGDPKDAENSIRSALRKVEPWEPDDGEGAYERDVAEELRRLRVRAEAQRRHQAAEAPEVDESADVVSIDGHDEGRRWIVPDMFPAGDFMMMYGPSRAGKSALLIDLSCQLDTGGVFMGHQLDRTRGLYLAAESANGVASRFRAWQAYHGQRVNVVVRKKGGLSLDNPASVAKFARYVKDEGFGVVFVDMVKHVAGSLEFDKNAGANGALIALNDVAQQTGALVIGTHHSKSAAPTLMEGNHAALYGTSNYVMLVQREEHGEFTAELLKDKDGQDGRQWTGHVVPGPNGVPVYVSDRPVGGVFR
ncbi:AAA family ATPase [Amycolatopsis orientalis]|uniref:AAA family ATPase n=1 Tax=Amycolatopsis orientalis TaxID=31958 RepID=UPI00055B22F2|nr:AAA family ATPase [Amycolatopsis orientalis]